MNYLQAVAFGVLLAWLMAACAVLGWGIARSGERRREQQQQQLERLAAQCRKHGLCAEVGPGLRFLCTRVAGHGGAHRAECGGGRVCDSWPAAVSQN